MSEISIRFWHGCKIIGDLRLSTTGSAWVTNPTMPNNQPTLPDIEIDPFSNLMKVNGNPVFDIRHVEPE